MLTTVHGFTDFHGEQEFDSLPMADEGMRRKALWWLKFFELISKEERKIRITDNGVNVAFQSHAPFVLLLAS